MNKWTFTSVFPATPKWLQLQSCSETNQMGVSKTRIFYIFVYFSVRLFFHLNQIKPLFSRRDKGLKKHLQITFT